jgi:hypothetical protein
VEKTSTGATTSCRPLCKQEACIYELTVRQIGMCDFTLCQEVVCGQRRAVHQNFMPRLKTNCLVHYEIIKLNSRVRVDFQLL